MNAISHNHLDFAARVARIEKNLTSSTQLLYVGVDEVYQMPRRDHKVVALTGVGALISNAAYPISILAAVILGALSHAIGQVLRFHVQGMPDPTINPDIESLTQIIVGIVVSMVLGYFMGLNSKAFTTLKSVGVVLGVLFMHNAVHMAPRFFVTLTSELWVNMIVRSTEPHSLIWRGISFVF